jgi:hypothetical protein
VHKREWKIVLNQRQITLKLGVTGTNLVLSKQGNLVLCSGRVFIRRHCQKSKMVMLGLNELRQGVGVRVTSDFIILPCLEQEAEDVGPVVAGDNPS